MKHRKIAHMLAVLLMIIWGLSYLSIKVVVEEINPMLSAFYRFFLAAIILFIYLKIKHPNEKVYKEDRIKLALGGLFGITLYFIFENYSVLFTSASNVAILISSIPVFTLFSQRIIYKERITRMKAMGAILSVVGLTIIIVSKDRVSLFSTGTLGDLMALGAAICWVFYNMASSNFKGNYKSITITAYQSLWGCLFLSPSLLIFQVNKPSVGALANIFFLAVLCSCIGSVIYIFCLERLGATLITTYINLQPIASIIFAALILKESVTIWQIMGCLIIITGVFLVSIGEKFLLKEFEKRV